jgi:hypothetical protein
LPLVFPTSTLAILQFCPHLFLSRPHIAYEGQGVGFEPVSMATSPATTSFPRDSIRRTRDVKVAKTQEEITQLLETGFEYVLQKDGLAFFRKQE